MRSGESRACSGDDASPLGKCLDAIEIKLNGRAPSSDKKVEPPAMGSEAYPPLQDAPGSYVLEK
jgi:hypothetical protein